MIHKQERAFTGIVWRSLVAAVLIGLALPAVNAADDNTAATAETTEAAILKELKAIRQLLEKIEKQGSKNAGARPARPTTATVAVNNKPVMGSDTAPVTVVEFTDYQCPFCLRFTNTTFPQLKRDYIDTGKVRWVALNLPLAFHKDARKAAQAAHCAGEQDPNKFWDMRLELFKHPRELGEEHLPEYAAGIGLDVDKFKACLASDRHMNDIDQDAKDARSVQLTGTPSFIVGKTAPDKITGQVVVGAQPLNVFNAAINKALGEDAKANEAAPEKPDGAKAADPN